MLRHHSRQLSVYDMHARVNTRWLRPLFARTIQHPIQLIVHYKSPMYLVLEKTDHQTEFTAHKGFEESLFNLCMYYIHKAGTPASIHVTLRRFSVVDAYSLPLQVMPRPCRGLFLVSRENIVGGNILTQYNHEIDPNQLIIFTDPHTISIESCTVYDPYIREGYLDVILFNDDPT